MNIGRIVSWLTAHPYVSATVTNPGRRIGRNGKCPCGSGLKYKNCCWNNREGLKNKYHRVSK